MLSALTITLPITQHLCSTFFNQWISETELSQLGHCSLMPLSPLSDNESLVPDDFSFKGLICYEGQIETIWLFCRKIRGFFC